MPTLAVWPLDDLILGLLEKAGEAPWEKWQPEYASRFLDATHEAQPLRLVLCDLVGVRTDKIPV